MVGVSLLIQGKTKDFILGKLLLTGVKSVSAHCHDFIMTAVFLIFMFKTTLVRFRYQFKFARKKRCARLSSNE